MSHVPTETPTRYSIREYLELEERADVKHEYHDGAIIEMTGADPNHVAIADNILIAASGLLKGGPCRAYSSDLRIWIKSRRRIVYPDVSVICGPLERDPEAPSTVSNPAVIVEVLSPSTRAYDRTDKFELYLSLESFASYVLVEQDRPHVEVLTRQPDGNWLHSFARGLETTAQIPLLEMRLPLQEIYAGVTFAAPAMDAR